MVSERCGFVWGDDAGRHECVALRPGDQEHEHRAMDGATAPWGSYGRCPSCGDDHYGPCPTLPNGLLRAEAKRLLRGYDEKRKHAYKNQEIAARETLRMRCGMGVRDLRKWLRENDG